MSEDFEKNFYSRDFMSISLLSEKIRIGIIGGGRAALIKTMSALRRGCHVEVLSSVFRKEFYDIVECRLSLLNGEYSRDFILDKHVIVIAIDGPQKNQIIRDCKDLTKIYVVCSGFEEGNAVIPSQGYTKSAYFSINTLEGNPKASVFLKNKIQSFLKRFDDFVLYTSCIRKGLKGNSQKDKIMDFIHSKDFYYFFKKGKGDLILKLFFGGLIYDKGCNSKKSPRADTGGHGDFQD